MPTEDVHGTPLFGACSQDDETNAYIELLHEKLESMHPNLSPLLLKQVEAA